MKGEFLSRNEHSLVWLTTTFFPFFFSSSSITSSKITFPTRKSCLTHQHVLVTCLILSAPFCRERITHKEFHDFLVNVQKETPPQKSRSQKEKNWARDIMSTFLDYVFRDHNNIYFERSEVRRTWNGFDIE